MALALSRSRRVRRFRSAGLRLGAAGLALALFPAAALAEELKVTVESRAGLSLTVYQQDLALVSEERDVTLPAGESLLAIEDVSERLRADSVLLSGAGMRLIEQSFVADLLTPERLLEASLGKTVRLIRSHPQTGEDQEVEAELLSLAGGIVLRIGERIEISPPGRFAFTDVPAGLRSEPALLARVAVAEGGERSLRLNYLTTGLSWRADYVARLNAAGDSLDLAALITLSNATGGDFTEASLRLVAGEVNQASPPVFKAQPRMAATGMTMEMADSAPLPEAAGDRYVYPVVRPVTLLRGETKQIPLMSAEAVTVKQEYRFESLVNASQGIEEIGPVSADLVLELENSQELGLGAPLPAGVVRIYGPGPGGQALLLGEDRMDQTPEGEKVEWRLGSAFDVTARAKRTVFERLSRTSYETGQEIVVKNAKSEAVEVVIAGVLPRGWTMLEESQPHEKESANRILWRLQVPAGGEAAVSYRLRVSN